MCRPTTRVSTVIELETPRLRLRQWRESDREPYAAMNADPVVMEFFHSLQSRAISDASIDGWQSQLATRGWSNWAVELLESGQFIGFVGLSVPRRALPFSPCVEVGGVSRAATGARASPPRELGPRWASASSAWPCRRSCRSLRQAT